jgi:magnesium-transporting ATPase (P-type)
VAVVRAASDAGLDDQLRSARGLSASFDPTRAFHAAVAAGRLRVKGAPEALAPRCTRARQDGADRPLGSGGREALLDRARELAGRGLRVLLVAEGDERAAPDDPQELVAVGFLGISDPLRPGVAGAVRRCREAGVRVVMITGDHPATARAIAEQAGLLDGDDILTGPDVDELPDDELDRRLARAAAVARATPLDKLRIVESLRRQGHTVGMTGDGVNDAPALRMADVGVAMGRAGTEVARQAADLVLVDDAFPTLVEALVEGRGLWGNLRRGLGLLLGGNLGEVALLAGAALIGFAPPLTTAQILTVNLITDALPALAVVVQPPEARDLAGLAREGAFALDARLRREVLRRGAATALPSLAAYLFGRGFGPAQAGAAAFGSVVAAQLAQTLTAGWGQGRLSPSEAWAVATSAAVLAGTFAAPWARGLLGLAVPGPAALGLIGAASAASVALNHLLAAGPQGEE